ncbi:histone-lysine N-methyltransferase ASHR2 [Diospyros lotus]|uniref:histone-lysine N-methyltransferase ASHR2 n=1 Tax=Diospyros lotus TaxID=55363 RepID=UPI00224EE4CD|nr:histone-lysine N-methyltransferase ASHR2 [Diospyros lotus]
MSLVKDGNCQTTVATYVRMAEIEGRGRALVASKNLRAGEIVLRDSPVLVYSALPLKSLPTLQGGEGSNHHYCTNCFRKLDLSSPSVLSCPSCSVGGDHIPVLFCSFNCQSVALALSHTPWVCQALRGLRDCHSLLIHHQQEHQVQVRFLIAAYNLAIVSPSNFHILLSLQGDSLAQPDDTAPFLHSLISSICPPPLPPQISTGFSFSLELTSALLAKDKLNAFGLMEPFVKDGERSVRAYAIYPSASFFNHDCLPNACRFDYLDASAASTPANTDIIVRMIHDVPHGREICLSYFPVNLNYADRQRRLREGYGFTCECDRCKVEVNWSDEEEDEEGLSGEDEAMDEEHDELMENSEAEDGGVKEESNFPHAYFFLRYMCNQKNCWGTLAPLPPSPSDGTPSSVLECNVCGKLKNDDEEAMDALEE